MPFLQYDSAVNKEILKNLGGVQLPKAVKMIKDAAAKADETQKANETQKSFDNGWQSAQGASTQRAGQGSVVCSPRGPLGPKLGFCWLVLDEHVQGHGMGMGARMPMGWS